MICRAGNLRGNGREAYDRFWAGPGEGDLKLEVRSSNDARAIEMDSNDMISPEIARR
jgi:hypothetical protein